MKFLKAIALGTCLGLSAAMAQTPTPLPPQGPMVSLSANLQISVCSKNHSICSGRSESVQNATVVLAPLANEPYHWRGYVSTVTEQDGVRYIGLVTIDWWESVLSNSNGSTTPVPPNPANPGIYTFKVEILGDHGAVAKMSVSVQSPDQLNNLTLVGAATEEGEWTYVPMFNFGPASTWNCPPSPNVPGNGTTVPPTCSSSGSIGSAPVPSPNPPTPPKIHAKDWNVMMGTLL